jgi:hypothetical protein
MSHFTPKVLTGNDLLLGDVIYLTETDSWSRDLLLAQLITDPDQAARKLAYAKTQTHKIVGPYLADMQAAPQGPMPMHFREGFRTRGPSNYRHGKQEGLL